MRRTVEIIFEFFNEEKNELDIKIFCIQFVSYDFMRRFEEIRSDILETLQLKKNIENNIAEMNSLNSVDKKKIVLLSDENDIFVKKIEFIYKGFPEKRINLLKDILKKNGVKDPELFEDKFWEEKVDFSEMNRILEEIVYKDVEKKNQKVIRQNFIKEG